jgi:tetratricopeptide (TPR) repeat protein
MSRQHEIFSKLTFAVYGLALIFAVISSASAKADGRIFYVNPDRSVVKAQEAFNARDHETALAQFRKAARRGLSDEHRVIVHNSICASLYLLERYEEATVACSSAIEQDRYYWQAYVNRGNARRALGDTEGAVADFCQAHGLRPARVTGNFEAYCEG